MERTAERRALTPRLTKISSYFNFFKKGLRKKGILTPATPLHEISMKDIMIAHYDIMRNHPDFETGEASHRDLKRAFFERFVKNKEELEEMLDKEPDVPVRWVEAKPFHKLDETDNYKLVLV